MAWDTDNIQYTTPALYTFEPMMVAEFHNVNFTCSPGSIIPSGPSYTDIAYQTCAYTGSKVGSLEVNGDDYLAAQFGFSNKNVWRDFGILWLLTLAYIGLTCWLSEVMEWGADSAGPIQYNQSRNSLPRVDSKSHDEESGPVQMDHKVPVASESLGPQPSSALEGTRSTFTWEDLDLSVQIGHETRKLLNNVCGYCKPGTLTALVGASGAGKSTCENSRTPCRNPKS